MTIPEAQEALLTLGILNRSINRERKLLLVPGPFSCRMADSWSRRQLI